MRKLLAFLGLVAFPTLVSATGLPCYRIALVLTCQESPSYEPFVECRQDDVLWYCPSQIPVRNDLVNRCRTVDQYEIGQRECKTTGTLTTCEYRKGKCGAEIGDCTFESQLTKIFVHAQMIQGAQCIGS